MPLLIDTTPLLQPLGNFRPASPLGKEALVHVGLHLEETLEGDAEGEDIFVDVLASGNVGEANDGLWPFGVCLLEHLVDDASTPRSKQRDNVVIRGPVEVREGRERRELGQGLP